MIKQKREGNIRAGAESRSRAGTDRTLAGGIILLSAAGVLVKAVGLVFRIPLTNLIGSSGMGYFNSAYMIYSFFYLISTAGLPAAVSILVSGARTGGDIRSCRRILSVCLRLFSLIGAILSLTMFFSAPQLSRLISNPGAGLSIAALSPCILPVCLVSALRGYFQGFGSMLPTALSQVAEALCRLGFGLAFANASIDRGCDITVTAAAAVSGVSLSSVAALIVLLICKAFFADDKTELGVSRGAGVRFSSLAGKLLRLSLPITASSAVMSLTGLLDLSTVMRRLQSVGYSAELSNSLYGGYTSLAMPLFNLPSVLITPIACAALPRIASAAATGDMKSAAEHARGCLKYALIISSPAAIGMSVLSEKILKLIFDDGAAAGAAGQLSILSLSIVFSAIVNITVPVMQACGRAAIPVVSMSVGSIAKLISSWFLIGAYGINGAPMSTLICFVFASVINLCYITAALEMDLSLFRLCLPPVICAGVSCAAAMIADILTEGALGALSCLAGIAAAALIYGALLLACGYVTTGELENIKGIGAIIRIFKKGKLKNET